MRRLNALVPALLVLAAPAAQAQSAASAEEEAAATGWFKAAGHAFDPSAYGEADMAPLVAQLGGARIIGIGEATHGGHQDQAFKAELIKALVRAGQVQVLMLEANRAAAAGFDHYVRTGKGDPAALIHSRSFFATWKDDEFAGLILWLRAWNMQAAQPVRITGIDCQDGGRDAQAALDFVRQHDPRAARRLRAGLGSLVPVPEALPGRFLDWFKSRDLAEQVKVTAGVGALAAWFDSAPAAARSDPGFADARQAARMAVQGFAIFKVFRHDFDESKAGEADFSLRDRYMADNAVALLGAGEHAALWAHDTHVTHAVPASWKDLGFLAVGMVLEERLGDGYRTVGFTWSRGAFWASTIADTSLASIGGAQRPVVQQLVNNRPGEYGALFDATGAQAMWVDFTRRPRGEVLDRWARRPYWRGWAGWGTMPGTWQQADAAQGYLPGDAASGFDVLVWFRDLSPARRWPALPTAKK